MASRVVLQDEFITLSVKIEKHKKDTKKGWLLLTRNTTNSDNNVITGRIVVQIGNVSVPLDSVQNTEMIPRGYLSGVDLSSLIKLANEVGDGPMSAQGLPQETLRSLQFMMKKQNLGQDIFLIGPPGPARRRLAMQFCELTQREVEYLCLSQDITESDIKQRREVKEKTVFYVDSASVKAALEGRVLILDGIEKAERNVLPIINNLLENREMALEDGRFICEPKRYDNLMEVHGPQRIKEWKLVKAHPNFMVIALGLPIPPYFGNSLDPPLRSRFQARAVLPSSLALQVAELKQIVPDMSQQVLARLLGIAQVFHEMTEDKDRGVNIPHFPSSSVSIAARLLDVVCIKGKTENMNAAMVRQALDFIYPFPHLPVGTCIDEEVQGTINDVYDHLELTIANRDSIEWINFIGIEPAPSEINDDVIYDTANVPMRAKLHLATGKTIIVPCGPNLLGATWLSDAPRVMSGTQFVNTQHQSTVLQECLQAHAVGDFCLVGAKGVGKSAIVREFSRALGYETTLICMYKDMTTRDLFERRNTRENGDTYWSASALVHAARIGNLAILDGLDMVHPGTIASLSRLVHDRELTLPSGDRLLNKTRYQMMLDEGMTKEELDAMKIYAIHPSFRIIAIARQPNVKSLVPGASWLTAETCALFSYVWIRPFSREEERHVLHTLCPNAPQEKLKSLLDITAALRDQSEDDVIGGLADSLSTRQLLRISRRLNSFPNADLHTAIHRACLSRFLPSLAYDTLEQFLRDANVFQIDYDDDFESVEDGETIDDNKMFFQEVPISGATNEPGTPSSIVSIQGVQYTVIEPVAPLLIPDILFYENRRQAMTLKEMLQDFISGDHMLLIGNQGVGKNKLADYFLQRLKLPREYIQLHRDTTVNQLTTQPSIRGGVLVFDDSPLVRAVREGYVLVIDEADKAPTHVTAILKALAEDKEMLLADGRRITANISSNMNLQKTIPMHPNFRMIILANRPGYPFLGNDFYKGVGSVFSSFAVDNPDTASEMAMLRKYGPDVPEELLRKFVAAFNELRDLVEEGQILYPYSTRELVNVVRHLQQYPDDNVGTILGNVFDFDLFSAEEREVLEEAFRRQGIIINDDIQLQVHVGLVLPLPSFEISEVWAINARSVIRDKFVRHPLALMENQTNGENVFELKISEEHVFDRVDARAEVFQEAIYLFKLPTRGPIIGTACLDNGMMIVASRSVDFELMLLDLEKGVLSYLDPYSTLPGAGTFKPPPTTVQIASLHAGNILLYDRLEHSLCIMNINSRTCTHAKAGLPLNGKRSTVVTGLARYGVVGVFCEGSSRFISIDLSSGKTTSIDLKFSIVGAFAVDLGLWMVESSQKTYHALHIAVDGQPSFRMAEIVRQNKKPVSEGKLKYISANARTLSLKARNRNDDGGERLYSHAYRSGAVVQLIPGLASTLSAMRGNPVQVFSATRNKLLSVDEWKTQTAYLFKTNQLGTLIESQDGKCIFEVTNVTAGVVRRIEIPIADPNEDKLLKGENNNRYGALSQKSVNLAYINELPDGTVVCLDVTGKGRVLEVDMGKIQESLKEWASMNGQHSDQNERLGIRITDEVNADESGAFEDIGIKGEVGDDEAENDGKGKEEGNGNGEGKGKGEGKGEGVGTGNGNGNGEGTGKGDGKDGKGGGKGEGKGGELSDVLPDLIDEESLIEEMERGLKERALQSDVPPEIAAAAKAAKEAAWLRVLEKLQMTEGDMAKYREYRNAVSREIRELRVVLESLEAKKNERQWLTNKDVGDLDDRKLIDGLTGDRNIYRLRGEVPPEPGAFQQLPKRIYFLFDLSMSMSRYSMDGRLLRSLQSAVMIMESFKGFEQKYEYQIIGHSGDTDDLVLVKEGVEPKNDRDRLMVVRKMNAHTEICDSGDNTIRSCEKAIQAIVERDADEHVVFLLSDANLEQYGIGSADLMRLLNQDKRVRVFILFIGSIGDQAVRLAQECPAGQVFVALDTTQIPKILKQCLLFISN
jgi:von Willebrand factor A domain-containing protein 8